MVPIPIALKRNTTTATRDLTLNLDKPHKPCPLVHPLPNLVPNPTNSPAIANPRKDVFSSMSSSSPNGVNLL